MIRKIIHRLTRILYSHLITGDEVYCPICEKKFKKFLDFGVQKRQNVQCPNCKSLERHRLIWLFIKSKKLLDHRLKLLHIAPEPALFNEFRKHPNIQYVPADKFIKGYSYPKETVKMDITRIPFGPDYFNSILCIHVLEHIDDDRSALKELFRVLKPGGWAIIMVPMDIKMVKTFEDPLISSSADRKKYYGQSDHVRLYGLDFPDRLNEAGFQVEINDVYHGLPEADRLKMRLSSGEYIYYCTK